MKTSFSKKNIKILLLENIHQSALDEFKRAGYTNIEWHKDALPKETLKEKIKDVHILGIRSKSEIDQEIIDSAERLHAIGCFCIGTNQVQLKYAAQCGVGVFNSPYSNTRSVAELVIGEIILLLRNIVDKSVGAHSGLWLKDATGSNELRGKTIGIIGYGHIGSQVSVLAESMGMRVLYYDVLPKLPMGNAVAKKTMFEVLRLADVVTLHVPELVSTKNLIDEKALNEMKKGSVLLNLSRGNVVDLDALVLHLKSKKIRGAGIDVFPYEPKGKAEKFESPLQGLSNVILTPHIGGSTEEAQDKIGLDVAFKLVQFMDTGSTVGSKSLPELNLPIQDKCHRILHIHKNVPGILSAINSIASSVNANIIGQYLVTNADIGYVVLDVEGIKGKEMIKELTQIKHTIRTRLLF